MNWIRTEGKRKNIRRGSEGKEAKITKIYKIHVFLVTFHHFLQISIFSRLMKIENKKIGEGREEEEEEGENR